MSDSQKLDLMAENSNLKVRLARTEKDLLEAEEKLGCAQVKISELQGRLNDRTIEVSELRSRLARSEPSSPERSLSNSFRERTLDREKTIERLKRKHFEVEKLKQAVESLMATNEEKDSRIEEMRVLLKRYRKLEDLVAKSQGYNALEQLGLDGDNISDGSSAPNSNTSSNDNALADGRTNFDRMDGRDSGSVGNALMPYPSATSTPRRAGATSSSLPRVLSNGSHSHLASEGSPLSSIQPPSSSPSTLPVPVRPSTAGSAGARSTSFDNVSGRQIMQSKTPPPTLRRRVDGYGTLPNTHDNLILCHSSQSNSPTTPTSAGLNSLTSPHKRPPLPPSTSSSPGTSGTMIRSSTVPRKLASSATVSGDIGKTSRRGTGGFMSLGKGLLKMRHRSSGSSGSKGAAWTSSAPNLGRADTDDETLKDEMAQQYKAMQDHMMPNGPTGSMRKKSSGKGIKRFFGKMKRTSSQELSDKMEEFKRAGFRSTAGPRLGWSKDINCDSELPFARWDTDRVALWMHVQGLSMYVGECKRWVKNGEQLIQATSHDLEKELGIRNYYHRKKLQLALQDISTQSRSPAAELDYNWVTRWLDDIGLPQYKDQFTEARIDGRMLHYLTVDDLIGLKVTNLLHHLSIRRGIQVLRANSYSATCLKRRPAPEEGVLYNCPEEVSLWSNHRVMEWLRNIDLSEYAPNLRGSGVHGGIMVYEPRFGAEVFALILSIPPTKTLLRRHLSTHFVALIGGAMQQQKRVVETQPGFQPLTLSQKIKVKKGIFFNLRADGKEDFVCPFEENEGGGFRSKSASVSSSLRVNGGGRAGIEGGMSAGLRGSHPGIAGEVIHREDDEHLLANDKRYLDSVPTSDV